jgi:predicted phosphodiesterase
MKIHLLSDLHCECSDFLFDEQTLQRADVIVLAGDIDNGTAGLFLADEMLQAAPQAQIVYVAGNHEHYHHDLSSNLTQLREAVQDHDRLHFLENDEVVIKGVRFLGATLWTDFELFAGDIETAWAMRQAQNGLNDFHLIAHGGRTFTPDDALALHRESVHWLEQKLNSPFSGKTVVATHHAPSFGSVAERYQADLLSACFASHLEWLMGSADLWLHGHTHDSFDYTCNGTRIVANPRGYCTYNLGRPENWNFQNDLLLEI